MRPALDPADRNRIRLRRIRAIVTVVVALALYFGLAWPLRHSITDDTYIHLVYAKHFRDGLGLVFNPGQGVYGTTSPLWSLGLGALAKTGIDLLTLAHGLALLFGALTVIMTAFFLKRFMDSWVESHGYGAGRAELAWSLAVIAFGADPWLVRWSATGMETALAAFLVTGGFAAYVGRRPWGNRVLVPATWWAIAALVRPEAMLLIVLLLARILLSSSLTRTKLERAGWALLPVALVHGPWLGYALVLYHSAVPATLAAKTAGGSGLVMFVDVVIREVKAIAASRGLELVALVALAPLLITRFWVRRADHFVPLLWMLGLPLLYAVRGVPAISRYLVPILPVLLAYAWSTFAWLAASERKRPRLASAGLVAAGLLSLGAGLFTYVRFVVPQATAFRSGVEEGLAGLGRWCKANTPPGTEIAIPDIGAFGYFADRTVVDLAGLVTPAITPLLRRYPYDDLVTNLRFEGVARPPYLVDRADMPNRMMFQSPYAPALTPIRVVRVNQRGISHPEPAYYTLYRVDWVAFDRMEGGVGQASVAKSSTLATGEARVPPLRSFSLRYWSDKGFELNTERGIYTVDRVCDPDTTIRIRWTPTELDSLRREAIRLGVFDLDNSLRRVSVDPQIEQHVEIVVDGRRKRFAWLFGDGRALPGGEWEPLRRFLNHAQAMTRRRLDALHLPKPRCGYL